MALPADFSKIFGSTATGGLTPIGDVNYAKGWEFVGSNPPTKNDFSYLQNLSDKKSQWLYSNKLQRTDPFGDIKSDGTVKTALGNLGLGNLKYGLPMIGELVHWPRAEMPQEIWTDCGMEFIPYMGQTFDAIKYPLLAQLHPTHKLPADMRGYVPRGWDDGRGIDVGRVLMSEQADAVPELTGEFYSLYYKASLNAKGVFKSSRAGVSANEGTGPSGSIVVFKASDGDPTYGRAAEVRVKNVAWNMIVRAK